VVSKCIILNRSPPKGRNNIILIDYSNYLIVFILLFSVECSSSVVSDLDSDLSLFIRTLAASVGQHSNFYFLAEEVRPFSCFHSRWFTLVEITDKTFRHFQTKGSYLVFLQKKLLHLEIHQIFLKMMLPSSNRLRTTIHIFYSMPGNLLNKSNKFKYNIQKSYQIILMGKRKTYWQVTEGLTFMKLWRTLPCHSKT